VETNLDSVTDEAFGADIRQQLAGLSIE